MLHAFYKGYKGSLYGINTAFLRHEQENFPVTGMEDRAEDFCLKTRCRNVSYSIRHVPGPVCEDKGVAS